VSLNTDAGSAGGEAGGSGGDSGDGGGGGDGGNGGSEGVAQVTEAQSSPQIEGIWASKLVWVLSLLQSLKPLPENMFCAAPPHAEWARWWPNETPPQPSVAPDAGSAAHRHAGDLANVPRSHGLVESVRGAEHRRHAGDLANVPRSHGLVESMYCGEHVLREPTARARRVTVCGCPSVLAKEPPTALPKTYSSGSQRGRRRTSMLVTWPTSHAPTGWLKAKPW